MAERMSHRERVQAVLSGERPDRPPVSVWRHFYDVEADTARMADAMLAFQRRFGWDYMKVNPRAGYHVEDWGVRFAYDRGPNEGPSVASMPVRSEKDWGRIQALDPARGVLGEHLLALKRIGAGLKGEVPYLMTVFSPLSIAGRLVGDDVLLQHMRSDPQAVHGALVVITRTYAGFAAECLNARATGIFFATTNWATHDRLTDAEYAEWGRPYDLQVLDAVRDAPFNMLHVCRSNNMLASLADYPAACVNWDARDSTNASLREGYAAVRKPVVGGISRDLHLLSPEEAARDARTMLRSTTRVPLMLGPGCTVNAHTSDETLEAMARAFGAVAR